jgi:hypothetical protein
MTKTYIDHTTAISRQEKAMEEARRRLNARGIYYPICTGEMAADEAYGRLLSYSEQEAAEIVKILREPPGGSRPLEIDNVAPKKSWGNSYYD